MFTVKVITVVLFSVVIFPLRKAFCESGGLVLSKAFEDITQALADSTCDLSTIFVTCDNKSINSAILDRFLASGVPFTVRHFKLDQKRFELNTSAIIAVESIDDLIDFNEIVLLTNN